MTIFFSFEKPADLTSILCCFYSLEKGLLVTQADLELAM